MATREEFNVSTINWIVDRNSYSQNSGRKINWAEVTETDGDGNKMIKSGTIVVQTPDGVAPRKLGLLDGASPRPAVGFLLESINEAERERNIAGQAVVTGGVVYANLLPDNGETDFEVWLDEVDENGTGLVRENFEDNRAS